MDETPPARNEVSADCVYAELRSDIRATDEISFKLLAAVPFVSAASISGLLALDVREAPALALFAATLALGLFRWELRNIQRCNWLMHCAQAMHEQLLPPCKYAQPDSPQRVGKTAAEKFVYTVTIAAWLGFALVGIAAPDNSITTAWCIAVRAFSTLIVILTAVSWWADTGYHATPTPSSDSRPHEDAG